MKFPLTTVGDLSFRVLLIPHNWESPLEITHRQDTLIGEGRTTIEERRPGRASWLLSQRAHLTLVDSDADDWRKGLAALGPRLVAMPLWVDALPVALWSTRIYAPQKVINFDRVSGNFAIYDAGSLPGSPAYPLYAPLLLGRFRGRPPAMPLAAAVADVDFELIEASPWPWRVGVNTQAGGWSALPNRISPVEDVSDYGLEEIAHGPAREPGLDRVNAAHRWRQSGDFAFDGRLAIRQHLSVFAAKRGAWGTISPLPAFFQPGASSSATPDNYTARFASDTLALSYATPAYAEAGVAFVQEVSTPGRDQALPGEAYLYRFDYALDPDHPELYASWDAPLTLPEGDYQPVSIAHQDIVMSLQPGSARAEIQMARIEGSLPADYLAARTYGVITLTIWKCDPDNAAATRGAPLHRGRVVNVVPSGNDLAITSTLFGELLEKRLQSWAFGRGCNVGLFSDECGLDEGDFDSNGTSAPADVSPDGMTLTVHGVTGWSGPTYPDNFFAYGKARTGSGRGRMVTQIVSSTMSGGNVVVKLKRPFWADRLAGGGQAVQLVPGCDHQPSTCDTKFDNYAPSAPNRGYRGFPYVPDYLEARTATTPTSPKK